MASLGLTNQSNILRALRPCCLPSSTSVRLSSSFSRHLTRPSLASTLSRPSALPRTPASKPSAHINRRAFSYTPTLQFSPSTIKMGASEFVKPITSKAEFDEKVIGAKGAVVVDCFATWCGPCKAIAPKVEQFARTYPDAIFYQIDVDELSDVAAELGVRAMPTFMLFKDGEKVSDVVGANPPALEAGIKSLLA
ncbi:thioredoxin-like protein [Aspergillus cavernicola]|uniref:Thioredoxin-like protein n=1 Tax=Aspergillus cavernicola TaxID=176166 RepID=A0ABR4ISW1_9EURO